MRVLVNGAWRDTADAVLAGLLEELGYRDAVVTTALNGEFVPVTARSATVVKDGDRIEVLAPMQGG
jgi:sulfur carrier protein